MINKFFNLNKNWPTNFQLAIYFYKIKFTYFNFIIAQKSSIRLKIPKLSTIKVELKKEKR